MLVWLSNRLPRLKAWYNALTILDRLVFNFCSGAVDGCVIGLLLLYVIQISSNPNNISGYVDNGTLHYSGIYTYNSAKYAFTYILYNENCQVKIENTTYIRGISPPFNSLYRKIWNFTYPVTKPAGLCKPPPQ